MSSREENIDAILADAANDLRIPTEIAQMFLRIGAELAYQHQQIVNLAEELAQFKTRYDNNQAQVAKGMAKLRGVHGA